MFQPDVVYAPIKDVSNCVVVVLEVACMICNSRPQSHLLLQLSLAAQHPFITICD